MTLSTVNIVATPTYGVDGLRGTILKLSNNIATVSAALDMKADLAAKLSLMTNDIGFVTTAGVRAAITVSGALSYNSASGNISYSPPTTLSSFTNDTGFVSVSGARGAISTSGALTYNTATGVLNAPSTLSGYTNDAGFLTQSGARAAISVTGALSYNTTTGVISYAPPVIATVATTGSYTDLANRPAFGTAALRDVGTSTGTVAAGDDGRVTGAVQKSANLSDLTNAATARINLGLGSANNVTFNSVNLAGTVTSWSNIITGPAGTGRNLGFQTGSSLRWTMFTDASTESGSNAGSDFIIGRYNDAGTYIDSTLSISRSNGSVLLSSSLVVGGSGVFSGDIATNGGSINVARSASRGGIYLQAGDTNASGLMEFYRKGSASRDGYIGFSNGSKILITAEQGYYNFAGPEPKINDQTIWYAGNFDPGSKHDLNSTISVDAKTSEKHPWAGTIANGQTIYQFVSNSATGVYDTIRGFIWHYDPRQAGTDIYLRGQRAWHAGNFDPTGKADLSGSVFKGEIWRDGPVATDRQIVISTSGKARWAWGAGSTSESGSNAGSDLYYNRYADDGTYIGTSFTISRSTGGATFYSGLSINGSTALNNGIFVNGNAVFNNGAGVGAGTITLRYQGDSSKDWSFINDNGNFSLSKISNSQSFIINNAGTTIAGSDLSVHRNSSVGVIYLGNTATRYLIYDGSSYQMPGAQLYVNGQQVWNAGNFDPATKLNTIFPTITGDAFVNATSTGSFGGLVFKNSDVRIEDWAITPSGINSGRSLWIRYNGSSVVTFNTNRSTNFASHINVGGNATISGSLILPAIPSTNSSTPTLDLITSVPANGNYIGADGCPFMAETCLGPHFGASQDLTRVQHVRFLTASGDYSRNETGTLLNMIVTNGFPEQWKPNTFYKEQSSCINGGNMYTVKPFARSNGVITSRYDGTSASSGGPTGAVAGADIIDGSSGLVWQYSPAFQAGNGQKLNLGVFTYLESNASSSWGVAIDTQISSNGPKINVFSTEIDLVNYRQDYAQGVTGPNATILALFTGGPHRSSAGIAIGQYDTPYDPTSLVYGITLGGTSLVSNATILDLTYSYNGFYSQGVHAGSTFTCGGASHISFNSFGGADVGFRHAGSSAIGLLLEGSYGYYQISGVGWNVNPTGVVTASGILTRNGISFSTDATQDVGSAQNRVRNLYLSNNPSVTSDQRMKTPLTPFTDKQLDAWGEVRFGLFQYLSAIEEKGEEYARHHAGVIAQNVVAALGSDAFTYGVVGKDPQTHLIAKIRIVTVPKIEAVMVDETIDVVEDGRAIRKTIQRAENRPVVEQVPLWNEDGSPVMVRRSNLDRVDTTGSAATADVLDARTTPLPADADYDQVQATHPVPVMVEQEEEYHVEEPILDADGLPVVVLNIRYEQLSIWEAAYLRRKLGHIENILIDMQIQMNHM